MERKRYYLVAQTTYDRAKNHRRFMGRTRIIDGAFDGTKEQASVMLACHLMSRAECYVWSDDNKDVLYGRDNLFSLGEMKYCDDGICWEYLSADEMNESDAKLAYDDCMMSDADEAYVMDKFDKFRWLEER
jgi:hypothetical protein